MTTSTTSITVYGNLTSGVTGNAQTICYNTVPVQLSYTTAPTGGTGIYTYQWYNTSGLISGATSSSYTSPALTSNTNFYCAVTSGSCGTLSSNTIMISVYGNLTSGVIGNAQTICYNTVPSQLSFTTAPTGGTNSYTFQWYTTPSSIISGATSSTFAPSSLTSSTTYYCGVTSGSCGTLTSNNITITVYGNFTAGISGGSSPICYNSNPGTFTATGSGGTGSYTYQWYNSSGMISGATNSTYNPGNLTSTTGFYCLITSGSCGTDATSTTTITVYGNLTAVISGGSTPICYNTNPGIFTATGTGGTGNYSYQWAVSSGQLITGATNSTYNPGNLTASSGYYCLVTSGTCGTATTSTTSITVYSNLIAGISGGTSPICYNTNPGTFTATGSGGTSAYTYQWYTTPSNIISGATSSAYNPGNITATTGYYCLVTSGSCGTATTSTTSITVYPNRTVVVSGGTSPICYNTSPGTFTATGTGGIGIFSYQWYNSSGIINGATNFYPLANYPYYKPITITNTSGSALSNYQVLITVTYVTGHMNSNFSDLIFTDGSYNNLNYWIQSYTASSSAQVWVNVTSIPTSGITIYVFYGNPNATSASSGTNTFNYYDDGSFVSSWTTTGISGSTTGAGNPQPSYYANSASGNYMYRNVNLATNRLTTFNVYTTGLGNLFFLCNSSGAGQMYRADSRGSTNYSGFATTSSWTSWNAPSSGFQTTASSWYQFGIAITSATSATLYYQNSTNAGPTIPTSTLGTYSITNNGGYIGLVGDALGSSYITYWDNIITRNYVSPEPGTSVGSEQGCGSTYSPGPLTSTTGYYCLATSGTCVAATSSTTTITVYGNLTASISGGSSPICYNTNPGTFTATGSGGTGRILISGIRHHQQ